MLGDEGGMAAHRRLLAVVYRLGGGEPPLDEIGGVGEHRLDPLRRKIGAVGGIEPEPAPERGPGEGFEQVVERAQLSSSRAARA